MRVGSEFLHLCQEQVHLLVQGLGASLAVIALAEHPTDQKDTVDMTFVPVITYPDAFNRVDPNTLIDWLAELWSAETTARSDSHRTTHPDSQNRRTNSSYTDESFPEHQLRKRENSIPLPSHHPSSQSQYAPEYENAQTITHDRTAIISGGGIELWSSLAFLHQEQMVMPLMYQDAVVGILVTARMDRGWNQLEQHDIQHIAQTISAACVLDQRSQWLEQRLHQQSMAYIRLYEQQKDNLADVLHQFRNPLTAVRTFGKLLLKRLQPIDRNHAVAESIVRESDRLQELLQQLKKAVVLPPSIPDGNRFSRPLTMLNGQTGDHDQELTLSTFPLLHSSKAFSDNHDGFSSFTDPHTANILTGEPIHLRSIAIMDILTPLIMTAQAIAHERHLTLHVSCPDTLPHVWADAKALREILNNLLDNALKYTPSGGDIYIVVGLDGKELDATGQQGIAIIDTGPGIPPEDQPHLFTRHFRGVQAEGNIPGTGLGLAIAQFLAHHMQGKISVFSPVSIAPISPNLKIDFPHDSTNPGTLFIVWLATHSPTKAEHP